MESDTHKALKEAVRKSFNGEYVREEKRMYIDLSSYFIVDVLIKRGGRCFLFECESNPSIPRLIAKGRRRNLYRYHNNYVLVIPEEEYGGHEWARLRGYFDRVIAYSLEEERFTGERDLRLLPWLQELVEESGVIQSYERLRYRVYLAVRHLKATVRKAVFVSRLRYACLSCWARREKCIGEECYWHFWRYLVKPRKND